VDDCCGTEGKTEKIERTQSAVGRGKESISVTNLTLGSELGRSKTVGRSSGLGEEKKSGKTSKSEYRVKMKRRTGEGKVSLNST